MIRISGGALRGRRIRVPDGVGSRPSSARLREAWFDVLAPYLADARVADLFAGSGLLGLEALSRGAAHVTFVEIDPRAVRAIRCNLDDLGVSQEVAEVRRADARRWLERLDRGPAPPGVVLLDPPYEEGETGRLLPKLASLVESGTLTICGIEHPSAEPIDSFVPAHGLTLRTRAYGRSAFTLIQRSPT